MFFQEMSTFCMFSFWNGFADPLGNINGELARWILGGNKNVLKISISKLLAKSHGRKQMLASILRTRPSLIVDTFASLHLSIPQVFPIGTATDNFLPSWSYAAPKLASCFISELASRTVLEAPPLCSPFRTRAADNTHWSVLVQCGLEIHKSTIFLHYLFFIGSKRVMIA